VPSDLCIEGWADRHDGEAAVAQALGDAGVNIEGLAAARDNGRMHVLVEDAAGARRALEGAGFAVAAERQVILRSLKARDQPGTWGRFARRLADAGVRIDFCYLASNTRIVVGVDDIDRAIRALQVLGG
jgi:hypothetical protein